ncbi:MAG TPA: hypothetical protein PKM40_05020 [Bacteroidia bacterium]|nr:hypothetical protein [Bacteroidia bacterium]MBX3105112.1 hypothetical protein [Bacteroidota bacterium]MCB8929986.1 hypothetical protein [Bacteroidia bacterium]HNQ69649.1 hypothetical protein [Bacteroidales bacterium]HNU48171.1 hypothetical protein [Bacteroidia bacterium]
MVFGDVSNYRSSQTQSYKGEYEICVRRLFWWQLLGFSTITPSSNFCFSYQYELVSFPFTINCAFNDPYYTQINLDCIPNSQTLRELYLPDPSVSLLVDNSNDSYWDYTINNYNWPNKLFNKTELTQIPLSGFSSGVLSSSGSTNIIANTLVSAVFKVISGGIGNSNGVEDRKIIPHSVIKHTINLHCGSDKNSPVIASYTFFL